MHERVSVMMYMLCIQRFCAVYGHACLQRFPTTWVYVRFIFDIRVCLQFLQMEACGRIDGPKTPLGTPQVLHNSLDWSDKTLLVAVFSIGNIPVFAFLSLFHPSPAPSLSNPRSLPPPFFSFFFSHHFFPISMSVYTRSGQERGMGQPK